MLPAYQPISFKEIDLRRYHVRDLTDVARFMEFASSRMEEVRQVCKNAANKMSTQESLMRSYKEYAAKKTAQYGNPSNVEEVKIETVKPAEPTSVDAEHKALLDELREETKKELDSLGDNPNERRTAEVEYNGDTYKATNGKNKVMFYKNKKLTSQKDIPEEPKAELLSVLGVE